MVYQLRIGIFKVDKSSSLLTVVHVMARMKGKNTIEMVKALTELGICSGRC